MLRWDEPPSDGGAEITGYQYRLDEGNWADVSDTTQTVSGLTNGTEYTFEVHAVNRAGEGPATSVSATPAVSKPGPVRNLKATPGDRSLTLRWEVPLSDGGLAF